APGLERELAEAQGLGLDRQAEEAGAVVGHGQKHSAAAGPACVRLRGMRIMSFNANGLRSAASKGFFDWFAGQDTDILCVQETKAQEHQLREAAFLPEGYGAWFRDATTKKGYSGVAVYSRRE